MTGIDPVALTAELIGFDTRNPPGNEAACAEHLRRILLGAGFTCIMLPLADGRPNLIARIGGSEAKAPLAFTGHLDVVPLGANPWSVEPFAGTVKDGRIWGRGASDMKSGVAAFAAAAVAMAPRLAGTAGIVLYITAAEETGAQGAYQIAANPAALGNAGALVVAEPSSNRPLVGHKGALWLKARMRGNTAHGSMPEQGVNAVYKAARAVGKLEEFGFNVAPHPLMGGPTLNVGFMHGGLNINSVPDLAEIGLDLRTIPGQGHADLKSQIAAYLGPDAELETLVDVPSVFTDPADPWLRDVFSVVEQQTGSRPKVETVAYFTDASALTPALGHVPTVILGPGPAHMAHQTDEWAEVACIGEAQAIYQLLMARWCGLAA